MRIIRRFHRVTALVLCLAVIFYLFFQVNKGGPFRAANPFGEDPYDAVGSFAIQAALFVGVLTYARVLRLRDEPSQSPKSRLILRGNALVVGAILVTLAADAVAEVVQPMPASYWGNVLLGELVLMVALALIGAIAVAAVFLPVPLGSPPHDLTPADGIDDLWTLVRIPVARAGRWLPRALVGWVGRFDSDALFARVAWLNPRAHPWRFACALGLLGGIALVFAQLQEGLPPSLAIGLLVTGIFMGGELVGTILGFALLGGYLGLRPRGCCHHAWGSPRIKGQER
jgi:hypothetical protein